MEIFIGKDSTTNHTGIAIIKDRNNPFMIINPENTPNASICNYFFTIDPKILKDLIAYQSLEEVTGGGELSLQSFDAFNLKVNEVLGGLISGRTTTQKREWYQQIVVYAGEIQDEPYNHHFTKFLELMADPRSIEEIVKNSLFSFEKGFVEVTE